MTQPEGEVARNYRQRSERFAQLRDECAARSRWLTHARLVAFLAAAISILSAIEAGGHARLVWAVAAVFFIFLFLALIVYHNRVNQHCRWFDHLSKLNNEGCKRLARDWQGLPQNHAEIGDSHHPSAEDLDLFGHASLVSLLGTVGTPPGRETLRSWLLEAAYLETIRERQAAVAELAPLIDVREEITVRGRLMPNATAQAVERFLTWAEGEPWLAARRRVVWSVRLLPLLVLGAIALNVVGLVSYLAWLSVLMFNLAFSYTIGSKVHQIFDRAFARESAFQQYAELLRLLAVRPFTAPLLKRVQSQLQSEGAAAHRHMRRLHQLLVLADVRFSMLYLPIQALTLWDFHVLLWLENWQRGAGRRARAWLRALGEADASAALATLRHDHPGWAFPEITHAEPPVLEARGLGHPLLAEHVRVDNDVNVGPPGRFLFVTGSNMSGKSTLLRAIGTNVVLARAGAPVCASAMRLPPLRLETSMRVHDSLQQGVSHFMAELGRLKGVIEAARRVPQDGGAPLLYLLDDILQGTNTAERRIAGQKVIRHLMAQRAIGAVTSHDLALADTEELSSACDPVHFSEQIQESADAFTISFDYKLRPGVATSKNALKLLQIVGLDSGDQMTAKG